jgi:8-amino-7-oxononanoate synthase
MDGDVAPLAALARISRSHDAWLVVDDAHGLGVIGETGRGAVEYFGLDAEAVPVLVGTLGKAFGSFGAFVAGSAELIEFLMQKARSYIYTTALPQPVAAASRKALEIAQRETWRRERVLARAERFRTGAEQLDVPLMGTPTPMGTHASAPVTAAAESARTVAQPLTPIQPVLLGSSEAALRAQRELLAAGFCVVAIRPPTVPQGSARLRVTLSAAHTEDQVDKLVETLRRVCAARDMVS